MAQSGRFAGLDCKPTTHRHIRDYAKHLLGVGRARLQSKGSVCWVSRGLQFWAGFRVAVMKKPASHVGRGRSKSSLAVAGLVEALRAWVTKPNFIAYTSDRSLDAASLSDFFKQVRPRYKYRSRDVWAA